MLRQLAVLSTISGGTITGVKYALCLAQEKSFEQFFEELYGFLRSDTLLPDAMAVLNNSRAWQGTLKQRNLINAFALVYHDRLFQGETFGTLLTIKREDFPEVAFNSTDIEHQMPFRFQKSERGKIGHGNVDIPKEEASEIRLGDIVAASSCFPGVFEPIVIPRDFIQNTNSLLDVFWTKNNKTPLRLMDGGIVDNQGINGVLRFASRNKDKPIGTFLISDVSSKPDKKREDKINVQESKCLLLQLSIRQINVLAWLMAIFSGFLFWFSSNKVVLLVGSIVFTICSLWLLLEHWATKKFSTVIMSKVSPKSPLFMEHFNILRTTKLKYLLDPICSRISSVKRVTMDVFLNRIRRLNYEDIFSDTYWQNKMKTNYIYDLHDQEGVSEALNLVIRQANDMETTLWFSAKDDRPDASMLDALVMAGQATMCHNLILYIETIKKGIYPDLSPDIQSELDKFQAKCLQDFQRFNDQPRWLMPKTV